MSSQAEDVGAQFAALPAGKAADTLRLAAKIADPYKRADAIWDALPEVRRAADRLWGWRAAACNEIARYLEEGCEGRDEPPPGRTLQGYARMLDGDCPSPPRRVRAADRSSFAARKNLDEGRQP